MVANSILFCVLIL